MEEQFSEGLTNSLQYMIVLVINSIWVAACVSTWQDNALSRGCFISSRLVWDPGIILRYRLVQPIDCMVVMGFLEDKQSLGREDYNVPIFGSPCFAIRDDFMGLYQHYQRGNWMLPVISRGLEDLFYSFRGPLIIFHHRDHSCAIIFRFHFISIVLVIWEYY